MHVHESFYLCQPYVICDVYELCVPSDAVKPEKNIAPGQIVTWTALALFHDTIRRTTSPILGDRPLFAWRTVQELY